VAPRDLDHRLECDAADARSLVCPRNGDQERAQDVGAALIEAARDRSVNSRRQAFHSSVPAHRDRSRAFDQLVAVEHVELEIGSFLGQATPVAIEHVAVVVVLRQGVVRQVPRLLGQVGPLPNGER